MIDPRGHVRLQTIRPPDRMIADRLRRAARSILLALRAPVLHLSGLFRHRERRPPAPSRVTRLLVLRTDRIGDMALTTPALTDLRAYFRKAEITVLAPTAPIELLRQHPRQDVGAAAGRERAEERDGAARIIVGLRLRGARARRRQCQSQRQSKRGCAHGRFISRCGCCCVTLRRSQRCYARTAD